MINETSTKAKEILAYHLEQLRTSGLNEETIIASGIYSETRYESLKVILNRSRVSKKIAPALVIPYLDANGDPTGYCRVKPDSPQTNRRGKPIKYIAPTGAGNRLYVPPGVAEKLERTDAELLVVEGEKKALSASQEGFASVGIAGVYSWKSGESEQLIPEMEQVKWRGREVRIVFDSDITENGNVADAEARLAKQLLNRGAKVKVARLPDA